MIKALYVSAGQAEIIPLDEAVQKAALDAAKQIKQKLSDPNSKRVRCPKCSRRFLISAIHCVGGEFTCWAMPPHKAELAVKKIKKQH